MRVLGVARKDEPAGVGELTVDHERDMTFIGYLAFLDPPKEDAGAAIEALAAHGVGTKVLTGDSSRVAAHVCDELGLDVSGALNGAQVEQLNDDELRKAVETTTVFAKLSPDQKARVVSVVVGDEHGNTTMITKGALEEVLTISSTVEWRLGRHRCRRGQGGSRHYLAGEGPDGFGARR